jgi:hypothetical protein
MKNYCSRRSFIKSTAAIVLSIPIVSGLSSCGGGEFSYDANFFKNTTWNLVATRKSANGSWTDNNVQTMSWEFRDSGVVLSNGKDENITWQWKDDSLLINLNGRVTYKSMGRPSKNNTPLQFELMCDDIMGDTYPYSIRIKKI